jgi:peptide subunit release factor 1 (eRF1)
LYEEPAKYHIIDVGGSDATLYKVIGLRAKAVKNIKCLAKNRNKKGGQSQNRYQRLRAEHIQQYVTNVADAVKNTVPMGSTLILTGTSLKRPMVYQKVLTWCNAMEWEDCNMTAEQIIPLYNPTENKEDEVIETFFEHVSLDDDLITYGTADVLQELQQGRLDIILTSEPSMFKQAENWGTSVIHLKGQSSQSHRFIRQFGTGAIRRWAY